MKQDIENIIKKNLPEKNEIYPINVEKQDEKWNYLNGFNQALSQINTSLMADEVLKVVGETKRDFIIRILGEQHKNELQGKGYDFYFVLRTELDYLSPNKENKNND